MNLQSPKLQWLLKEHFIKLKRSLPSQGKAEEHYEFVTLFEPKGRYRVRDRHHWEQFWNEYCQGLEDGKITRSGIAQLPPNYAMFCLDQDYAVEGALVRPLYTVEAARQNIIRIQDTLKAYGITGTKLDCCLLTKEPYSSSDEKTATTLIKHGYHLQFIHLFLSQEHRILLENELLQKKLINDTVAKKPWLLYGATKRPDRQPYVAHSVITAQGVELAPEDYFKDYKVYGVDEEEIPYDKSAHWFFPRIFDIRPTGRPVTDQVKTLLPPLCELEAAASDHSHPLDDDDDADAAGPVRAIIEAFLKDQGWSDAFVVQERDEQGYWRLQRRRSTGACPVCDHDHERTDSCCWAKDGAVYYKGTRCRMHKENAKGLFIGRHQPKATTKAPVLSLAEEEEEEEDDDDDDRAKADPRGIPARNTETAAVGSQIEECPLQDAAQQEPLPPTQVAEQAPRSAPLLNPYNIQTAFWWRDFFRKHHLRYYGSEQQMKLAVLADLPRVCARLGTKQTIVTKVDAKEPFALSKAREHDLTFGYYVDTGEQRQKKLMKFSAFVTKYATDIPQYNRLTFRPLGGPSREELTPHELNIWPGFKAVRLATVDLQRIEKILQHIKEVWAAGDDYLYRYVLSWLAHIVKKPYEKTEVAVILQSNKQGCGKSMLTDFLAQQVFGRLLSCVTAGLEPYLQKFNKLLEGKLFVNANELTTTSDTFNQGFDKMKHLITDATMTIEPKGVDAYEIDSYLNFVFTTNHVFTVKIEESDRRYLCLQCSDKYVGDHAYFAALKASLTDEAANHFFTFLCDFQESVPLKPVPMTELKRDMIELSKPSPLRFLRHLTEEKERLLQNINVKDGCVKASTLYQMYEAWCGANGEHKPLSSTAFGKVLLTVVGKKRKSDGSYYGPL